MTPRMYVLLWLSLCSVAMLPVYYALYRIVRLLGEIRFIMSVTHQ
jgi:hypothetical protein